MLEAHQLIPVEVLSICLLVFCVRCVVDLQLLTLLRFFYFLRLPLSSFGVCLLDVWAGESPCRDFLSRRGGIGVDVDWAGEFGRRHPPNITHHKGKRLPYDGNSFDHVNYKRVREQFFDPINFLADLPRVSSVRAL